MKSLVEEQGMLTCWANGLTLADGVQVFFTAPSVRIFSVVDHAKFRASLAALVAGHSWDTNFVTANGALTKEP